MASEIYDGKDPKTEQDKSDQQEATQKDTEANGVRHLLRKATDFAREKLGFTPKENETSNEERDTGSELAEAIAAVEIQQEVQQSIEHAPFLEEAGADLLVETLTHEHQRIEDNLTQAVYDREETHAEWQQEVQQREQTQQLLDALAHQHDQIVAHQSEIVVQQGQIMTKIEDITTQEMPQAQQDVQIYKGQLAQLEQNENADPAKVEQVRQQLEQAEEQLKQLQTQWKDLNQDMATSQQELAKASQELSTLEMMQGRANQEYQYRDTQVQDAEKRFEDARTQETRLESQLERVEAQISEAKGEQPLTIDDFIPPEEIAVITAEAAVQPPETPENPEADANVQRKDLDPLDTLEGHAEQELVAAGRVNLTSEGEIAGNQEGQAGEVQAGLKPGQEVVNSADDPFHSTFNPADASNPIFAGEYGYNAPSTPLTGSGSDALTSSGRDVTQSNLGNFFGTTGSEGRHVETTSENNPQPENKPSVEEQIAVLDEANRQQAQMDKERKIASTATSYEEGSWMGGSSNDSVEEKQKQLEAFGAMAEDASLTTLIENTEWLRSLPDELKEQIRSLLPPPEERLSLPESVESNVQEKLTPEQLEQRAAQLIDEGKTREALALLTTEAAAAGLVNLEGYHTPPRDAILREEAVPLTTDERYVQAGNMIGRRLDGTIDANHPDQPVYAFYTSEMAETHTRNPDAPTNEDRTVYTEAHVWLARKDENGDFIPITADDNIKLTRLTSTENPLLPMTTIIEDEGRLTFIRNGEPVETLTWKVDETTNQLKFEVEQTSSFSKIVENGTDDQQQRLRFTSFDLDGQRYEVCESLNSTWIGIRTTENGVSEAKWKIIEIGNTDKDANEALKQIISLKTSRNGQDLKIGAEVLFEESMSQANMKAGERRDATTSVVEASYREVTLDKDKRREVTEAFSVPDLDEKGKDAPNVIDVGGIGKAYKLDGTTLEDAVYVVPRKDAGTTPEGRGLTIWSEQNCDFYRFDAKEKKFVIVDLVAAESEKLRVVQFDNQDKTVLIRKDTVISCNTSDDSNWDVKSATPTTSPDTGEVVHDLDGIVSGAKLVERYTGVVEVVIGDDTARARLPEQTSDLQLTAAEMGEDVVLKGNSLFISDSGGDSMYMVRIPVDALLRMTYAERVSYFQNESREVYKKTPHGFLEKVGDEEKALIYNSETGRPPSILADAEGGDHIIVIGDEKTYIYDIHTENKRFVRAERHETVHPTEQVTITLGAREHQARVAVIDVGRSKPMVLVEIFDPEAPNNNQFAFYDVERSSGRGQTTNWIHSYIVSTEKGERGTRSFSESQHMRLDIRAELLLQKAREQSPEIENIFQQMGIGKEERLSKTEALPLYRDEPISEDGTKFIRFDQYGNGERSIRSGNREWIPVGKGENGKTEYIERKQVEREDFRSYVSDPGRIHRIYDGSYYHHFVYDEATHSLVPSGKKVDAIVVENVITGQMVSIYRGEIRFSQEKNGEYVHVCSEKLEPDNDGTITVSQAVRDAWEQRTGTTLAIQQITYGDHPNNGTRTFTIQSREATESFARSDAHSSLLLDGDRIHIGPYNTDIIPAVRSTSRSELEPNASGELQRVYYGAITTFAGYQVLVAMPPDTSRITEVAATKYNTFLLGKNGQLIEIASKDDMYERIFGDNNQRPGLLIYNPHDKFIISIYGKEDVEMRIHGIDHEKLLHNSIEYQPGVQYPCTFTEKVLDNGDVCQVRVIPLTLEGTAQSQDLIIMDNLTKGTSSIYDPRDSRLGWQHSIIEETLDGRSYKRVLSSEKPALDREASQLYRTIAADTGEIAYAPAEVIAIKPENRSNGQGECARAGDNDSLLPLQTVVDGARNTRDMTITMEVNTPSGEVQTVECRVFVGWRNNPPEMDSNGDIIENHQYRYADQTGVSFWIEMPDTGKMYALRPEGIEDVLAKLGGNFHLIEDMGNKQLHIMSDKLVTTYFQQDAGTRDLHGKGSVPVHTYTKANLTAVQDCTNAGGKSIYQIAPDIRPQSDLVALEIEADGSVTIKKANQDVVFRANEGERGFSWQDTIDGRDNLTPEVLRNMTQALIGQIQSAVEQLGTYQKDMAVEVQEAIVRELITSKDGEALKAKIHFAALLAHFKDNPDKLVKEIRAKIDKTYDARIKQVQEDHKKDIADVEALKKEYGEKARELRASYSDKSNPDLQRRSNELTQERNRRIEALEKTFKPQIDKLIAARDHAKELVNSEGALRQLKEHIDNQTMDDVQRQLANEIHKAQAEVLATMNQQDGLIIQAVEQARELQTFVNNALEAGQGEATKTTESLSDVEKGALQDTHQLAMAAEEFTHQEDLAKAERTYSQKEAESEAQFRVGMVELSKEQELAKTALAEKLTRELKGLQIEEQSLGRQIVDLKYILASTTGVQTVEDTKKLLANAEARLKVVQKQINDFEAKKEIEQKALEGTFKNRASDLLQQATEKHRENTQTRDQSIKDADATHRTEVDKLNKELADRIADKEYITYKLGGVEKENVPKGNEFATVTYDEATKEVTIKMHVDMLRTDGTLVNPHDRNQQPFAQGRKPEGGGGNGGDEPPKSGESKNEDGSKLPEGIGAIHSVIEVARATTQLYSNSVDAALLVTSILINYKRALDTMSESPLVRIGQARIIRQRVLEALSPIDQAMSVTDSGETLPLYLINTLNSLTDFETAQRKFVSSLPQVLDVQRILVKQNDTADLTKLSNFHIRERKAELQTAADLVQDIEKSRHPSIYRRTLFIDEEIKLSEIGKNIQYAIGALDDALKIKEAEGRAEIEKWKKGDPISTTLGESIVEVTMRGETITGVFFPSALNNLIEIQEDTYNQLFGKPGEKTQQQIENERDYHQAMADKGFTIRPTDRSMPVKETRENDKPVRRPNRRRK